MLQTYTATRRPAPGTIVDLSTLCSWCDRRATLQLVDGAGWTDRACEQHGDKYGETYRYLFPATR